MKMKTKSEIEIFCVYLYTQFINGHKFQLEIQQYDYFKKNISKFESYSAYIIWTGFCHRQSESIFKQVEDIAYILNYITSIGDIGNVAKIQKIMKDNFDIDGINVTELKRESE